MHCNPNNICWSYFPTHCPPPGGHQGEAYPLDLPELEEQSDSGSINENDYEEDKTTSEIDSITNIVNNALQDVNNCETLKETLDIDGSNWDGATRRFLKHPGKGVISAVKAAIEIDSAGVKPQLSSDCIIENPSNLPVEAILRTYLSRQRSNRPNPNALLRNVNRLLQDTYRLMLVDWLVEVALEWSLKRQTLHRAILYVDRFLSVTTEFVLRNTVQLLGCTCLMLACKMEEIKQESARKFQEVTDNTYEVRQILEKELSIVKVLECKFSDVTIIDFLVSYSEIFRITKQFTKWFAMLMADICLHNPELVAEEPARVALAVLTISLHVDGINLESRMHQAIEEFVPYSHAQIQQTAQIVGSYCVNYTAQARSQQEQGLKYIILTRLAPTVALPYPLSEFRGGTGTVVPPPV